MRTICLLLFATSVVCAQQPAVTPSMQAESSGKCSPNILANKGEVRFVCNASMDGATADKIVTLLNRILQQRSDGGASTDVNQKLDEILQFLRNEAQAREPRRVPADRIEDLKLALSAHPATFNMFYVHDDGEAYQLAEQISGILTRSGWTLAKPIAAIEVMGPPAFGMRVAYRGLKPEASSASVKLDLTTPEGILSGKLMYLFRDSFSVDPAPNNDADIHIFIYPNPKLKPTVVEP